MRWLRRGLLIVGALTMLSAIPVAAAADEMYLGLRDVDCTGATVSGSGLPAGTQVTVTVLNGTNKRELDRHQLTTSASGGFTWRSRTSLSGLNSVRAVVAKAAGAGAPIAWTDHQVPTACPLAYTGAGPVLPLVGLGLSSIVVGFLLLTAFSYKGRHLLYQGRHVAR
jgi:hypothetical protein